VKSLAFCGILYVLIDYMAGFICQNYMLLVLNTISPGFGFCETIAEAGTGSYNGNTPYLLYAYETAADIAARRDLQRAIQIAQNELMWQQYEENQMREYYRPFVSSGCSHGPPCTKFIVMGTVGTLIAVGAYVSLRCT